MTDNLVPKPGPLPNERVSAGTGAISYVSNAILLSYFGNFWEILESIAAGWTADSPLLQTAIAGRFRFLTGSMAIV